MGHVDDQSARGGTGYGASFAAANKNDLGGSDLKDIMTGVDAIIAAYPMVGNKLALMGYSYGGEMAAFVEGKTDRFKAIISAAHRSSISKVNTVPEDQSWYDRWFYGKPWEHSEDAWRQSPLAYVAQAETPFMLIQGEGNITTARPKPGDVSGVAPAGRGRAVTAISSRQSRSLEDIICMDFCQSTEPWHQIFDARRARTVHQNCV